MNYIAAAPDLWGILVFEGTRGDFCNLRYKGLLLPVARYRAIVIGQDSFFIVAV